MIQRPRRNRKSAAIRGLAEETTLTPNHLVQPLFLVDGKDKKNAIKSLPNIYQLSIDNALKEIESCMKLGIRSFILFPAVANELKNKTATYSYSTKNFYLKAIKEFKKQFPECCLISDVAMDPYSSDGHDGYVENGKIINDKTNLRYDLQCYARVVHLMAHYELGNDMLMESLSKSVYRFMAKMKNLTTVEEAMFKFLRQTIPLSPRQLKPEFEKLLHTIKHLEKNRFETRTFAYLDIISWVESKVFDKPMGTVIHEKYLQSKRGK